MENEGDSDVLRMVLKGLEKRQGRIGNQRKNQDSSDDAIVVNRRPEETCYHSDSSKEPPASIDVKNSPEGK